MRYRFLSPVPQARFSAPPRRRGTYVPISLIYVKETGTPKENIANGSIPLCKPPRFAHLCTSWTKPQKLCPTVDDSLHYSFTALPAAMYVRSRQKQVGTMCPHRALWGNFKGALPLDALFFGKIIFPKMQSSVAVAFLRGDAAQ